MASLFLYHGRDAFWVKRDNDTLKLTVCSEIESGITALYARCEPDNEQQLVPMARAFTKGRLQYWQAGIPLSKDKAQTLYAFKALTGNGQQWLDAKGVLARAPGQERHFRFNSLHTPPQWVQGQVFYQIFPDRFANANPAISVKTGEYSLSGSEKQHGSEKTTIAKAWGEPVSPHGKQGACEFYGGDLQGIVDKLDHLQSIGITALYLNPVFTAPSNHKYDTADYLNIDPHLGTNEEFAALTAELRRRGMRIVLDAVFNHTSLNHPWFDRFGKREDGLGAWQNPASPYRGYYQFDGDSDNYIGWNGVQSLPKLNYLNPAVQDYFYGGENAVIKHWLRPPYQVDGWRFDVIHMLGEGEGASNNAKYVRHFRQATKSENPDAMVLGEHFFEATSWLQGEQEDGAMNYYGFAHPARAFFAGLDISYHPGKIDSGSLKDWLDEAIAKVPWQNQLCQLNQLDSHDTARFLTLLDGDTDQLEAALAMLFCWPGVPCLYYGTEVALEGGQDPDNRRCMPWQQVDDGHPMLDVIRKLAALRRHNPALQQGSLQWLYAGEECLVFSRHLDGNTVLCAINNGDKAQKINLPLWQLGLEDGSLGDLFSGKDAPFKDGVFDLELDSNSHSILVKGSLQSNPLPTSPSMRGRSKSL